MKQRTKAYFFRNGYDTYIWINRVLFAKESSPAKINRACSRLKECGFTIVRYS